MANKIDRKKKNSVEGWGGGRGFSPIRTRFLKNLSDKVAYIFIKIYSNCRKFNYLHFGVFRLKFRPRMWALDQVFHPTFFQILRKKVLPDPSFVVFWVFTSMPVKPTDSLGIVGQF